MPFGEDIVVVHRHIRACLVAGFGDAGQGIRGLDRGSIMALSTRAILALPDVGGVLISGTSLRVTDFDAVLDVTRAIPFTRGTAAS